MSSTKTHTVTLTEQYEDARRAWLEADRKVGSALASGDRSDIRSAQFVRGTYEDRMHELAAALADRSNG